MAVTRQQELKARKSEIQRRLKNTESDLQAILIGDPVGMGTPVEPATSKVNVDKYRAMQQSLIQQSAAIDALIEADQERVRRLHHWLTIEAVGGVSTIVLAKGSVYLLAALNIPFIFWYSVLILAAVAFAPFMLVTICREKRFGWLFAFAGMVGVPCLLFIIPIQDPFFTLAFQLLPLLMFYAYCGLLRFAVEDWLEY